MKQLLTYILLLFFTLCASAQDLTVKSFAELPKDISARTNLHKDLNGNPCALVKVQIPLKGLVFRGDIVGDVVFDVNEYYVYLPSGTKRFTIKHSDYQPLSVVFEDFGISSVKGSCTYQLKLLKEQNVTQSANKTPKAQSNPSSPRANKKETGSTSSKKYENGHEYVDLGLSVKWATMNVGATEVAGSKINPHTGKLDCYGEYFAWGETKPKDNYSWSNLKYCSDSSGNRFTKYVASSSYGTVDNKATLDLTDDAAHVNWGGSWRMPTKAELDELRTKCTWTWTTMNGVKGYKVTAKNGNSIFLPAAGYRRGSSFNYVGLYGDYWSSSLDAGISNYAYSLVFYSYGVGWGRGYRGCGLSVRPVCP